MKPAWDELGSLYKDHGSILIGDADCTASGKSLCEANGIRGYPTIKYFVDGEPADYQGGRDLASLKKFVEENLGGGCDISDIDATCDEKEQKYIKKMKKKGAAKIASEYTRLDKMKGDSMKPALKKWLSKRLNINKQLKELSEDEL